MKTSEMKIKVFLGIFLSLMHANCFSGKIAREESVNTIYAIFFHEKSKTNQESFTNLTIQRGEKEAKMKLFFLKNKITAKMFPSYVMKKNKPFDSEIKIRSDKTKNHKTKKPTKPKKINQNSKKCIKNICKLSFYIKNSGNRLTRKGKIFRNKRAANTASKAPRVCSYEFTL